MSRDSTLDPLVISLNTLLSNLDLPFALESPLDLTPSLLLAILESILESRLLISQAIRESREPAAKVQAMKIFLGVMESDVIQLDVGLSDVDPRRLAVGEPEEVVFVGELLCWLGKKMGLCHDADGLESEMPPEKAEFVQGSAMRSGGSTSSGSGAGRILSPSTHSTLTNSMNSALSVDGADEESNTTITSVASDASQPRRSTSSTASSLGRGQSPRLPLCIHEIEDPSFLLSAEADIFESESEPEPDEDISNLFAPDAASFLACNDPDDPFSSPHRAGHSVRYNGYIEEVDNELEVEEFEASRRQRRRSGDDSQLMSNIGMAASRVCPFSRLSCDAMLTLDCFPLGLRSGSRSQHRPVSRSLHGILHPRSIPLPC